VNSDIRQRLAVFKLTLSEQRARAALPENLRNPRRPSRSFLNEDW
jgi:hypothetical protein